MAKGLKIFASLLALLCSAYLLLIDDLIRTQFERIGSRAAQAPLTIGSATFHLLPTSLTLYDIQIRSADLPAYNLIQADTLSLPLSLGDLLAHKLLVDQVDIHGVRFNRMRHLGTPRTNQPGPSATSSSQLRDTLQRIQLMLNHPLASNTVDPNTSITAVLLADQFSPLLAQLTTALGALASPTGDFGDWQILLRRINVDGIFEFGSNASVFNGTIDNVTPQPQLFDSVTQFDFRGAANQPATLQISGDLDKRKHVQATLRFRLDNFDLSQWTLSADSELKITIVSAKANVQALLTLTGNQVDLNVLTHLQAVRSNIAHGDNEIARTLADVWRATDNFDIHLQASGDIAKPSLKINSSLDIPLAHALQQRQLNALPSVSFPASP